VVKLTKDKYRLLVATRYLNASDFLFAGLKVQQGNNDFHFVVTLRSFIEYTRRGIWFLAWASDKQLQKSGELTFDKPGSPGLAAMDTMINEALGKGKVCHLMAPVKDINNEPFLNCLHALTHGNPISVRMLGFGLEKIFQTNMLLVRAETDLNLFRVLLYRRVLGENLNDIWKMLAPIHNEPVTMRENAKAAAVQLQKVGIPLP
jgi:hypothetical protein